MTTYVDKAKLLAKFDQLLVHYKENEDAAKVREDYTGAAWNQTAYRVAFAIRDGIEKGSCDVEVDV